MERLPSLAINDDYYEKDVDDDGEEKEEPGLSDDDGEEKEEPELSDDDESDIIIIDENFLSFAEAVESNNSEWKLANGELVSNVLLQKALMVLENSKNKRLTAFTASVIRLGLSSIVDLSSEFPNGMHTWFGEEWSILKQKAQSRINMLPVKFEGCILESILKIEGVC